MEHRQIPRFKVCVECMTYNHSKYIEDAMNGFVKQETAFPFICIVMDDASTDGEQEVILRYINEHFEQINTTIPIPKETADYTMLLARHRENKNCFFGVFFLKYNHYLKKDKENYFEFFSLDCDYMAMCEGDDYWAYSLKLQKQVDFLENHHDYALVHTDNYAYNQEKGELRYPYLPSKAFVDGEVTKNLIRGDFFIAALTACYRKKAFLEIDTCYKQQHFLMGDLPLWIELSRVGKVKFLPEKTSVYRELKNSAAHSTSRLKTAIFHANLFEVRRYFIDKYNYSELQRKNDDDYYYSYSLVYALERKFFKSLSFFIKGHHYSCKEFIQYLSRFVVKP